MPRGLESLRRYASGSHLRIHEGASSGALNMVGDASKVTMPAPDSATDLKLDAYHDPVWCRYFGKVR